MDCHFKFSIFAIRLGKLIFQPPAATLKLMAMNQLMTSFFPCFLILLSARVCYFGIRQVAALPSALDGSVIELIDSNFESAISSFDYILVDFYAPWCGHCKRLSPVLDEAAPNLARLNQPVVIAKLDADKYRKLASKYEIDGFPTLKLFVHGVPIEEYKGARKSGPLIQFLKKHVAPDVTILESPSAVHSFVEEAGQLFPIFIGFGLNESLISECGKRFKKNSWFAVAKNVSDEFIATFDIHRSPAVVAIHPNYDERNVFYGHFEAKFLDDFVRQNQLPLVVPITQESLKILNNGERKIVLTIVYDEKDGKSVELFKILRSAANANRDLVFGCVGFKQWEDFASSFDVNRNTKLPKILVWGGSNDYQLLEGFESLNNLEDEGLQINKFLNGYREGRTIKKEISESSFINFVSSLVGMKTVWVIILAIAFLIVLQTLVRRGDVDLPRMPSQAEAEELKRPLCEVADRQQDYQPRDKKDD